LHPKSWQACIFVQASQYAINVNEVDELMVWAGLQKVWKLGRSFPRNCTCSWDINQLQVK